MLSKEKLEYYEKYFFSKSKPIPYNLKCGVEINIYPIMVDDIELFEDCYNILLIDKDSIKDVNIIKMSYLQFLKENQFKIDKKIDGYDITIGQNQMSKFQKVLSLCLKEEYVSIEYDNNKCVIAILELDEDSNFILKAKITNKEFEEIKNIILHQNYKGYDDRKLDPKVQALYNDYIRLKYKDVNIPNIEEKKEYVMAKSGFTEEQINKMTYRRFDGVFDCLLKESQYYGNKIIEGSYKFKCDSPSKHFLLEKKRDKYDGFITDGDSLQSKIK